jgi:cytochrome bd ubiquinol oxidase subunit I
MHLDPVFLSRLQWAWVIGWHILLPAFTVGLASFIAVLEGLHFFTGKEIWFRISGFWTKIFAVSFGMGVVSGIIMPFQFGTNWARFSDAAANIISPLMAYEDLMAFFLEASFLGVLLFGRTLVPRWAHFLAAVMVATGTLMSSFWILSANSWMQTPAGFKVVDGRFFPTDWLAIVFNPSFPYRLAHNVTAFYITTGFVVLGVGAYLFRSRKSPEEARLMVRMALNLLIVLVPLQIILGDMHGLNTREHQPTKLAAIEGVYDTEQPDALALFGIPDDAAEQLRYAIRIPHLGSVILTHSWSGEVKGLKEWPPQDRPPVWPVFFGFRIMVGIGLLMLATVVTGWILRLQHRLFETGWFLRLCQWVGPLGFVAVIAGWTTTEVGRQPWTVFGLLRTADSVSPSLTGGDVLGSLLLYMAVYLLMFPTGIVFMLSMVRGGVQGEAQQREAVEGLQSRGPATTLPLPLPHPLGEGAE